MTISVTDRINEEKRRAEAHGELYKVLLNPLNEEGGRIELRDKCGEIHMLLCDEENWFYRVYTYTSKGEALKEAMSSGFSKQVKFS